MKRTKYDAPAPRVAPCEVDTLAIWNRKKTVSEDLFPIISKALSLKREDFQNRPNSK